MRVFLSAPSSHELRTQFRLGGPIENYIGLWGDLLRGILHIWSRAHISYLRSLMSRAFSATPKQGVFLLGALNDEPMHFTTFVHMEVVKCRPFLGST